MISIKAVITGCFYAFIIYLCTPNHTFTHKKTTAFIITYYMGIVLVTYFLRHIDINLLFLVVLSLGFFGAYLPNIISKMKK